MKSAKQIVHLQVLVCYGLQAATNWRVSLDAPKIKCRRRLILISPGKFEKSLTRIKSDKSNMGIGQLSNVVINKKWTPLRANMNFES